MKKRILRTSAVFLAGLSVTLGTVGKSPARAAMGESALALAVAKMVKPATEQIPTLADFSKTQNALMASLKAPPLPPGKPASITLKARQADMARKAQFVPRPGAASKPPSPLAQAAVYRPAPSRVQPSGRSQSQGLMGPGASFAAPAIDMAQLSDRRSWSCVPFVQRVSAVQLRGDGWMWWDNAQGKYARGQTPRPGSVLVFKRQNRLGRGHVAMVRSVIDSRTIRVDHANWGRSSHKGRIDLNVLVVDVSPQNDWSRTKVWYTPTNSMGETPYGTYGFVYPTSDRG